MDYKWIFGEITNGNQIVGEIIVYTNSGYGVYKWCFTVKKKMYSRNLLIQLFCMNEATCYLGLLSYTN